MAIVPSGIFPIDPTVTNGSELAQYLNDWVLAFHSQSANASRPPMIARGGVWAKTLGAADIALMLYDGTTDHEIGKIVGGNASFGGGTNAGATAPTSPAAGDMWFDTAAKVLNVYDGANWTPVDSKLNPAPLTLDAVNNRVGINQATPAGQLHIGADNLIVDASGKVGIGTSSPGAKLHLAASGMFNQGIRIEDTSVPGRFTDVMNYTSTGPYMSVGNNESLTIYTGSNVLNARIEANGDFKLNSGFGIAETAYGCRAWVNFNGTGTVAIRAGGNVSSITDMGTGKYQVNFTTLMPDANFACVIGYTTPNWGVLQHANSYTPNSVIVEVGTPPTPTYIDASTITVTIFR